MKTSLPNTPAASGQGYDAVLHDWIILPLPDYPGTPLLVGIVSSDRKNRFADGRCIHTSAIVTPLDEIVEGAVAEALNTRYLLGEER
ncbi:hypothetical protein [Qipengyuania nanhaisediminis]|uniref:Uncharacterized protein n=1 Tax=Qipengyuania nanhaisediminis TaxID=604088 RepID=A0A1I5MJZ3_9SPHN|nr:hypothetical protein [Qipengyuania nanhaisediminis]SFP09266.1 hypothetical protein SAMN04488060_1381 [Qipengyuania nanhaisediminis]